MSKIKEAFERIGGGGALVAYVMGGDPDPETSSRVIEAVVRGGADIVEIGIPFSDPIADGKTIQEAGARALKAGTKPEDVLEIASRVKVPVVLMTYYNIIHSQGLTRFLERARDKGVDGLVIPDLPLEETEEYRRAARESGLDAILLASPATQVRRMKEIAKKTSGFLYLVSLYGVTGQRDELASGIGKLIQFARRFTNGRIPLCVGFGISKPEHVLRVVEKGAEGAIVGSAIVDRVALLARGKKEVLQEVELYVRSLREAARKGFRKRELRKPS